MKHPSINEHWRLPLYLVASVVGLAIYGTIGYMRIMSKLDNAMTVSQAQDWIDTAREHNPNIFWPRLPERHTLTSQAPEATFLSK